MPRRSVAAALLAATAALARADTPPIDYSHCGYAGGGVPLPDVPARVQVIPSGGDDTAAVQAALDEVGRLAPDAGGFRGAVLLRGGTFRVEGTLRLDRSGVVLRGSGATLLATGQSRRALIEVEGRETRRCGTPRAAMGDVPAGTRRLRLASVEGLKVGDAVIVRRPSTEAWLREIGMRSFAPEKFAAERMDWTPGSRDLAWDRRIEVVEAGENAVTLDAPLTTGLEDRFGGGRLEVCTASGRIEKVAVESLGLESAYDRSQPADEEHAWFAVSLDHVENAWVRDLEARHFVSSAVRVGAGARSVTVQDVRSESPVGEDGGWRRVAFWSAGQLVLFNRCSSDRGRHALAVGQSSPGPTVFLECTVSRAGADAGPFESWAGGVLYDRVRVDGAGLTLGNLGTGHQGAGWNAAGSVVWNSRAEPLSVASPPTAVNLKVDDPSVLSLYRRQLEARLGAAALRVLDRRAAPSSPGPLPRPNPASTTPTPAPTPPPPPVSLENGRFVVSGRALFGSSASNAWWKGQANARARDLGFSPTRFVPGRVGPGLTEDLDALTDRLAAEGRPFLEVWPGLWYDRRRDDHTTGARADAEVWAPFYEMPWARSGKGQAWDGLSRYDLTRFNPWYFDRLRTLARLCTAKGLVLVHHFYNVHNFIEAAAHWADFPWRPANALQDTGLPEPPPYEREGSRIAIANRVFDVTHPVRRDLHRLYIRHGLAALRSEPNVVHVLGFQDEAPLSFQRFFLDVVAEWEKETGADVRVGLTTGKNVTDAILADPERAPRVDVIDTRYWQYLADGSVFAPPAGEDRAFREFRAAAFGRDAVPDTTPERLYEQVREYRDRFPGKAVIAAHAGAGALPALMAGGAAVILGDRAVAQPARPDHESAAVLRFVERELAVVLPRLAPLDGLLEEGWCLGEPGRTYLLYSGAGPTLRLTRPLDVAGPSTWLDVATGATQAGALDGGVSIAKPSSGAWLLVAGARETPGDARPLTVYLAGDSTMQTYPAKDAPRQGWGARLGRYFDASRVTVSNHAVSGRSSRSFIEEGRLDRIFEALRPGDYLLVQFGHNDQKTDHRHTDAATTYKEYLSRYVDGARRRGAVPVLVTPVGRRTIDSAGAFVNDLAEYADAMRELAAARHVPLVDLNAASLALYRAEGAEGTKALFLWTAPGRYPAYPDGVEDNSHFQETGAERIAGLVAEALRGQGVGLARHALERASAP